MTATPGEQNPYRAPEVTELTSSTVVDSELSSRFETLGRVLVTREGLRVVYNLIGAVPSAILLIAADVPLAGIVIRAFVANLCYCLGPLVDCYLTWLDVSALSVNGVEWHPRNLTMQLRRLW